MKSIFTSKTIQYYLNKEKLKDSSTQTENNFYIFRNKAAVA